MNEKDLRIGNWIKYPSGIYYQVDMIYKNYTMLKIWKPIKITAEILLNCGFKIDFEYGENELVYYVKKYKSRKGVVNILSIDSNGLVQISPKSDDSICICLCKVKYLHELQNLYFSLAKKELKVNL
jgi:hypothetical protein